MYRKDLKFNKTKNNVKLFNIRRISLIFVFAFIVYQIVYTIQVSSYGGKLSKLEMQYSQLLEENNRLSAEYVKNSSLSQLGSVAVAAGFVKPNSIIYISANDSVAQAR